MHRLEVAAVVADVAAGGEAEAAHDARAEVGEDVTEHVLGDQHPEALGPADHPQGDRVDVEDLGLDLRVLARDQFQALAQVVAAVAQHVRLVDQGEPVVAVRAGVLEAVAQQPVHAEPGLQAQCDAGRTRAGGLGVGVAADHVPERVVQAVDVVTGVQPLGVLADHREVEATVDEVDDRADVGVQAQPLAQLDDGGDEGEPGAAQVVGQFGLGFAQRLAGDGAEQAGVGLLQQFPGPPGDGVALLAPAFPADLAEAQVEWEAEPVHDVEGRGGDVRADAVAGEYRDALHVLSPFSRRKVPTRADTSAVRSKWGRMPAPAMTCVRWWSAAAVWRRPTNWE